MQSTRYLTITREMAQANPEYWAAVRDVYTEQAARIAQHAYRGSRGKIFHGKYEETLTGALTLHFLKEPLSLKKAKEHADRIKAGQATELDFNDPEFLRNIYKALRIGLLNRSQMALANELFHARLEFQDPNRATQLQRFAFDAAGPYDVRKISYATEEGFRISRKITNLKFSRSILLYGRLV